MRWERITSDDDTVDYYLSEGLVEPKPPSEADMVTAQEVLAMHGVSTAEQAQQLVNVIKFLDDKIAEKQRRGAIADAKRRYAEQHGIPVSQVRIKRK